MIQNIDQKIQNNDKIQTGENSKIRFVIKDGLIIQLGENTEFILNYQGNKYYLKLQKGWIAAVKKVMKMQWIFFYQQPLHLLEEHLFVLK